MPSPILEVRRSPVSGRLLLDVRDRGNSGIRSRTVVGLTSHRIECLIKDLMRELDEGPATDGDRKYRITIEAI